MSANHVEGVKQDSMMIETYQSVPANNAMNGGIFGWNKHPIVLGFNKFDGPLRPQRYPPLQMATY